MQKKMNHRMLGHQVVSLILALSLLLGTILSGLAGLCVFAQTDEPIGWVTVSIERSVIGEGFYLEPTDLPVYEADTFESFMDRVVEEANLKNHPESVLPAQELFAYAVSEDNIYSLTNLFGADYGQPQIDNSVQLLLSENREKETLKVPEFSEETPALKNAEGEILGFHLEEGMYTKVSTWRMTLDGQTVNPIKDIQFENGSVLRIRFSLTEDGRDLALTADADPIINQIYGKMADMEKEEENLDEEEKTLLAEAKGKILKTDLTKEEAEEILNAFNKLEKEKAARQGSILKKDQNVIEEQRGSTDSWPMLMTSSLSLTVDENNDSITQKINACAQTRLNAFAKTAPGIGTSGGDWTIMCLCRSENADESLLNQYYQVAVATMQTKSGVLSKNSYTEYSRLILGLTAAGKDVTCVGGYNLLNYLTNFVKVKKQGLNGPIWALIALDSYDYEIPQNVEGVTEENYNSRKRMVEYILDQQCSDGGWNYYGKDSEASDPDMTGMAMVSLYRYMQADASKDISANLASRVTTAMNAGLNCLSKMQKDSGDFASWGAVNAESTVWVYMAMCCMNIDPLTDSRFIKNGNTVLDAIQKYYIESENYGAGFQHVMGGGWNDMATDQAMYGLVAYDRYRNGQSFFFDMRDVEMKNITDISLDRESGMFSVGKNETVQLNVNVEPSGAVIKSIQWDSSDLTQAEVDQKGLVTVHLTEAASSKSEPVAVINCTVTAESGADWTDDYEVYAVSKTVVENYIQNDLPKASQLNSDNLNKLVTAEKAYQALSDSEKANLSKSTKEKLNDVKLSASDLTHQKITKLWSGFTANSAEYVRQIKVQSGEESYDLPWNAQLTVLSPESGEALKMQAQLGGKKMLQAADISLKDLLTDQDFDLSEGKKVTITMDVPYTVSTNTDKIEIIHFKPLENGGYQAESITPVLSLDRQSVTFSTDSFSCFAFVVTEKKSGGNSRGTGSITEGGKADSTTKIASKISTVIAGSGKLQSLLEQSGLTLGTSDIQMVDITQNGGTTTTFKTEKNLYSQLAEKVQRNVLPFAAGCFVTGMIWLVAFSVKEGAGKRRIKKVNQNIKKRNQKKKD